MFTESTYQIFCPYRGAVITVQYEAEVEGGSDCAVGIVSEATVCTAQTECKGFAQAECPLKKYV